MCGLILHEMSNIRRLDNIIYILMCGIILHEMSNITGSLLIFDTLGMHNCFGCNNKIFTSCPDLIIFGPSKIKTLCKSQQVFLFIKYAVMNH